MTMYDQLEYLEHIILDIKEQHRLVSEELKILKQQPSAEPTELSALKSQLDSSYAEHDTHKKQLDELDNRYQNLAEAHHMIGAEQKKLQQQVAELQQQNSALHQQNNELKAQNSELHQKNVFAAERIKVVFNRLALIDQTPIS